MSHHFLSFGVPAEYVNFLSCVTPDNQDEYMAQMRRFNLGVLGEADCPVFDGLFEYCQVGIMVAAPVLADVSCLTWHLCTCRSTLEALSIVQP